jgi:hypothetical protein
MKGEIKKLNRRTFGKQIGLTALLPILFKPGETIINLQQSQQTAVSSQNIPDEITGRKLSEEEIHLTENFLEGYDKSMADLHTRDLPHDLLPAFLPTYPKKKLDKKAR